MKPIKIDRSTARTAVRLLRKLQIHLEDAPYVYADLTDFKSAEKIIRLIDVALGDRIRPRSRRQAGKSNAAELFAEGQKILKGGR